MVCETINYLRARVSHRVAVLFREGLAGSNIVEITSVTPSNEEKAFEIFKHYTDKDFSFTDCTSFAVMKSLKLKRAFAFDRHFEQFGGITRVPTPVPC